MKTVYTIAASHAPRVVQCHGNCYIESVLGAIQDKIHTEQRQQGAFFMKELTISRVGPNARLLSVLIELFLHGDRGPRTAENARHLINGGSLLLSFEILKGIDIPLFKFSYRDPYDNTGSLISDIQGKLALQIAQGASDGEIREKSGTILKKAINDDFHHRFNADTYYHVNSIAIDNNYWASKSEGPKKVLKAVVDDNVPTIASFDAVSGTSHVARVAGYELDGENIVGIVITDTNLHEAGNEHTTQVRMSLTEFSERNGLLIPLQIDGHFVEREHAQPVPLASDSDK